ncbi:UDP-N-acetylglucosamine 2-epimerase (non-hydrolyzing), partial [bacterium]|nr:UDP-N-acetylglucosamine 2-epimerase (non-hydrolyzing) [bacterium]
MKAPVVVVVGTRPDAIKLLPVYSALKKQHVPTLLCATHQHVHMLDQVLQLFDVQPDISFNVMVDGQSLSHVTAMVLQKALCETKPALVIVQGDTTTSLAAALAAFYNNIPVAHVEAGLRTYDKRAPFPEEINRTILTQLADYHFAPTPLNAAALLRDHQAHRRVFNVGNTVVDALHYVQRQLQSGRLRISPSLTALFTHIVRQRKKLVLVTTHRRESFGGGMANIMTALKKLARLHKEYVFLLPMHLNPLVRTAIHDAGLQAEDGVVCLEPLPYHELVAVLERAAWVMTDSGGIQEEAVCLGKRVLVMRDVTERVELLWHGMGVLCGTAVEQIVAGAQEVMRQQPLQQCRHMYGDGFAAPRIVSIVRNVLGNAQDRVCSERRINHMKRVSVVGLGYIGLPTAILAAQAGYDVCGFDTDQEKVKQINSGNPVIFEPEISERLWKVLQSSFFKAHTELQYADCFIIAVPTPFKENRRADLSYVFKAADAIVKRLMPGNLVILESTVPVGTTEQLAQYLEEH